MADESPKASARSPLIQEEDKGEPMGKDFSSANGVKMQKEKKDELKWKIRYRDFAPSRKGHPSSQHSFRDLIERANDWLLKNRDHQVVLCETVTWMDKDESRLVDTEQMIHAKPIIPGFKTHFLRGLRVWVGPAEPGEPVKRIAHFDVIPDKGDTVQSLTEKLNKRLEDNPLKGRLLNIQTLAAPQKDFKVDNDCLKWAEDTEVDSWRAFLLRVYSLEDIESNKSAMFISLPFIVQVRDFVPKQTDDGYEGFEQLVENGNTWLKDQHDVRIINIQSVLAPKLGTLSDTGNRCFFALPGCSTEAPSDFFRILRMVYTKLHQKQADGPAFYPFYFETFMPQMVSTVHSRSGSRKETLEKMRDVCQRADEFLLTTGTEVVCCESVLNPMTAFDENGDGQMEDMKWLVTVRLYTTKQRLPQPLYTALRQCSMLINSDTLKNKASEAEDEVVEHPGPIFLGNVVNRDYRYRWIVVSVVAFVTMTCIVVLSIVYANK